MLRLSVEVINMEYREAFDNDNCDYMIDTVEQNGCDGNCSSCHECEDGCQCDKCQSEADHELAEFAYQCWVQECKEEVDNQQTHHWETEDNGDTWFLVLDEKC